MGWPTSVKNFLQLQDGVDYVIAQHPNERGDEITAIETWLSENGGAKDAIVRGFKLTYKSTTDLYVEPGTLYHDIWVVNKTARTTLTLTTAADWYDGATHSYSGGAGWCYIGVDSSGNIKLLGANPPNKADTAGNTVGDLLYSYIGTTYWRVIGDVWVHTDNTLTKRWYYDGDSIVFDSVVADANQRIGSGLADTSFTAKSLVNFIPATAKRVDILQIPSTNNSVYFRPTGSSATEGNSTKVYDGIQYDLPVDSNQSIDYKVSSGTVTLYVRGYKTNLR